MAVLSYSCVTLALLLASLSLRVVSASSFASAISSSALRHRLLKQRTPAPTPCTRIRCPDQSKCKSFSGVPICTCPSPFVRLAPTPDAKSYVCTTSPLAHSDYLDPHNAARAAVGSPPLTWSTAAATAAQKWVDVLKKQKPCLAVVQPKRGSYGQNVFSEGYRGPKLTTSQAMYGFIFTGVNYTLAKFDALGASGCRTGYWQDCVPYIQVVWSNTNQVGCATAKCGKGDQFWVCNYSPPGAVQSLTQTYYPFSPCYKTTCTAPQLCDPTSGYPPSCALTPCSRVRCASGTQCKVDSNFVPSCSPIIQNGSVPETSVALFPQPKFAGIPFVFRLTPSTTDNPVCVNVPSTFTSIASIQVTWNVGDAASLGGKPLVCQLAAFWNSTGCTGGAYLYNPDATSNYYSEQNAQPFVRVTKSMSCV